MMTEIENNKPQESSVFDSLDNFLLSLKSINHFDNNNNNQDDRYQQPPREPAAAFDTMDDYLTCLKSVEFSDGRSWAYRAHALPSQINADLLCGLPSSSPPELSGKIESKDSHQSTSTIWDSIFMDALTKAPSPQQQQQQQKTWHLPELKPVLPAVVECASTHINCCNVAVPQQEHEEAATTTKPKKRRQRVYKSRRVVPEYKEYVDEYNDFDIICGRGARSNKHPGNRFYLELVEERKPHYRKASDQEKREIVLDLLTTIHERGGRILELEKTTKRWYVSHEKMAYIKAGQALRDNNDEASRAAKREKYGSTQRRKKTKKTH